MTEEIFGPVLPLVPYDDPAEAEGFVAARPVPLALYVFGRDAAHAERVAARLPAGGGMVNGCVLHVAVPDLPFGGAGASGFGAYHGQEGFRAFTRPRSLMVRRGRGLVDLARPPYGATVQRLIAHLLGPARP